MQQYSGRDSSLNSVLSTPLREAHLKILLPPFGFMHLNDNVIVVLFTWDRHNTAHSKRGTPNGTVGGLQTR